MADMTLVIDPDGSSFALHDRANGRWVTGLATPTPATKSQWAGSIDSDGERRAAGGYTNRTITATVNLQKSSAALLQALERDLGEKVEKLVREGGVLRLGTPAGTNVSYEVREASMQRVWDPAHVVQHLAAYELSFVCAPDGYGSESDLGDNTETTLPALIFSEGTLVGDMDGLGRLLVDNDSAGDWSWLAWGIEDDSQYTHTTSSGSGALFYQAESRTTMGGAAGTAVATASGGTVVRQGALTTGYLAMLSTQASGGGAHLSHVGAFNVFARIMMPTTNTGDVSVAWEWAQGDFRRYARNTPVTFPANHSREGQWILQRLGQVIIPSVPSGSNRWEGRIVAKSTSSGDDLDVDYLMFMPARGGEAAAVQNYGTPTSFDAHDTFDQSAGTITGKTANTGGTWAGAGDADDFSLNTTTHVIERTANGDSAGTGRYVVLGSTMTNSVAQVDLKASGGSGNTGLTGDGQLLHLRYVDTSNWLGVRIVFGSSDFVVQKRVAGTITALYSAGLNGTYGTLGFLSGAAEGNLYNTYLTLRLAALASGWWAVWGWRTGSLEPFPIASGYDSDLATGGTLASGKGGVQDLRTHGTGSVTRTFDNFALWTPPADAAVFAGQSIDIRSDGVIREDSTGTYWNKLSAYRGDYLLVPPSGQEGRTVRVIVKPCRDNPDTGVDSAIDDVSAHLFVTPRFNVIPE